ncbi:MAG: type II toxin-antitoxin system VapC family toxin [Luteolibacter sp.]
MVAGRYLLDTHTVLWTLYMPERLPAAAREAITNADELFVSIISPWEIAIKFSRGGFRDLPIPQNWDGSLILELERQGYRLLAIQPAECRIVQDLPFHHKDPFDRMMIAQAMHHRLDLISADEDMGRYGVKRIW